MGIWDLFKGGSRASTESPVAMAPVVIGEADRQRVAELSARVASGSDEVILAESRRLGPLVAGILEAGREVIAPGATTSAVANALLVRCRREGLEPAMLGYQGFPAVAAVSINEEIVHGMPSERRIEDGDLVKLEMGVVSGAAFAAQSWTFAAGKLAEEDLRLLETGKAALRNAAATISGPSRVGDIGAAIQAAARADGFDVVKAYVGHGMGKRRFQDPQIPGVGPADRGLRLRKGMILNVQVIIKRGSFEVEVSANRWTAIAEDGERGVIFTGMVEVTADGHVALTREVRG